MAAQTAQAPETSPASTAKQKQPPAPTPAVQIGTLAQVPLKDLSPDTNLNPRIYRDSEPEESILDFGETLLKDSSEIFGLKHTKSGISHIRTISPPIVTKRGGLYTVFEGRRRLQSLKAVIPEADWARTHVIVDVVDGDDKTALARLAAHANTERKDLSVVEVAVFGNVQVRKLLSSADKPASESEIANFLKIPLQTWKNLHLPLAQATPRIRQLVHQNILGAATFAAIKAQLKAEPSIAEIFATEMDKKAAEKEAEKSAKEAAKEADKEKKGKSGKGKSGSKPIRERATPSTPKVGKPAASSKPLVTGAESAALLKKVQEQHGAEGVVPVLTKAAEKKAAGMEGGTALKNIRTLLEDLITSSEGIAVQLKDYSAVFKLLLKFVDGKANAPATLAALGNVFTPVE